MTNEEIKQIIDLAKETAVAELEVQRGENRVRVRFTVPGTDVVMTPTVATAAVAQGAPSPVPTADPKNDPNVTLVKSPIVGTFYSSPSPGAPAFVKPGDSVRVGQVLCIIESMKLMNEIESEVNGTITAVLVENGHAVEYGEALFAVRPA